MVMVGTVKSDVPRPVLHMAIQLKTRMGMGTRNRVWDKFCGPKRIRNTFVYCRYEPMVLYNYYQSFGLLSVEVNVGVF